MGFKSRHTICPKGPGKEESQRHSITVRIPVPTLERLEKQVLALQQESRRLGSPPPSQQDCVAMAIESWIQRQED